MSVMLIWQTVHSQSDCPTVCVFWKVTSLVYVNIIVNFAHLILRHPPPVYDIIRHTCLDCLPTGYSKVYWTFYQFNAHRESEKYVLGYVRTVHVKLVLFLTSKGFKWYSYAYGKNVHVPLVSYILQIYYIVLLNKL